MTEKSETRNHGPALTRRHFLRTCGLGLLSLGSSSAWANDNSGQVSIAAAFDREIEPFMEARKIPGGALAVIKNRRLVYARGYGWADRGGRTPARPDSLFRIASISKPFTAVGVLQLVEKGKLELDAPAFALLASGPGGLPLPKKKTDPRLEQITVRHLLQHTGGWDRDKSFDPMFRSRQIAKSLGVATPPGPRDIIRYMLDQPLDFDPGTRYAYSNFGYCVLGRIIERITRLPYERYLRQHVLAPVGIKRMRLGASQITRRADGEVRYYTSDDGSTRSVFDDAAVPWPYGGFCLETMDAHGGWIASAVDLARFAAALADPARCPVLKAATLRTMYALPVAPVAREQDGKPAKTYYGCGWSVRPVGHEGKANCWHNGSLPGTFTLLVRRWDGLSWAAIFNQRSEDKKLPDSAIDAALHRAADAVSDWPARNLFGEFGG